ncbi:MAG: phage holin family protein [Ktedonobacterales bacterium]
MMAHGETPTWKPEPLRFKPLQFIVSWLLAAAALGVTAAILPGVHISDAGGALLVALVVAALNAVLPPVFAALRLPFTLVFGFLLALVLSALLLQFAANVLASFTVDSFWWALLAAIVVAAVGVVLQILFSANDDNTYTLRVIRRIARRQGGATRTDASGIVFLEIDGLALPVLRRAMRDGSVPNMAAWLAEHSYRLIEWETDLSSQTGASQAGILLGSNHDIPAFRWVEKETGTMMTCSAPEDCARIERERATGKGLLVDGGASRGNLLSGEAEAVILTVSRMEEEKRANPGYRAFFANAFNVLRALDLFAWEVILEWTAAIRAKRRDVRPRGHRGGIYPLMRGAMCVIVRDLIVYGVLTDMMRGRPAIYATFSSYDEVAHHSGLERADTLEALRKLDQQFGRIERARRYAPRPYAIVVLSDHGQTQGATFKQRNGYGLDELVKRSVEAANIAGYAGGDEQHQMVGLAIGEATGRTGKKRSKEDVSDRQVVVLGSGNLGLIYLMEEPRRLTREEIDERHPRLIPALRSHPHVGWILVRSAERGAVVLGPRGEHYLDEGRVEGEDPLAAFSPNAPRHLLRTDGFPHVADIMVGSFYDPELDEGCAFEELISFHGGIGGPQTRPFIFAPVTLPRPKEPIIGAEHVHEVLWGWRRLLNGDSRGVPDSAETVAPAHALTSSTAFDSSNETAVGSQ